MHFKLLIVDDSELVRTSLRKQIAFATEGLVIREVCTLGEALIEVKRDPPSLVILDLHLPDGFGVHIIQSIKELAPASRIAIVTIDVDPEIRDGCLALGADWFFDKATELGQLMEVVRQLTSPNPTNNPTNNPNPDNIYE